MKKYYNLKIFRKLLDIHVLHCEFVHLMTFSVIDTGFIQWIKVISSHTTIFTRYKYQKCYLHVLNVMCRFEKKKTCKKKHHRNYKNQKFNVVIVWYSGFFSIFTPALHSRTCLTREIKSRFNVKPLNNF